MTDSRPVLEQYNELLGILGRFTQHKMNMDESIQEELTLVELVSHLRIEESLRMQDSDKPKGKNISGPLVVNMVEHNNSSRYNDNKGKRKHHDNTKADPNKKSTVTCWKCGIPGHLKRIANVEKLATKPMVQAQMDDDVAWWVDSGAIIHVCKDRSFMSTFKPNDLILWHARLGHVHFKRMQDMSKDGLISCFDMDTKKCKTFMQNNITKKPFQNVKRKTEVLELIHSDLYDLHATPLLRNKKYFVTFIDDASRFYVIEPNDSVSINSKTEYRDAIFDENRFSSVPRPSLRIFNGTKYIGGSMVPKEVTKEDDVFDQHSYCFNVEDDPKTFDEAMKSKDVAFWKEAINDKMDSIMGNNTWV
nr:zinc finger, CCHC-type [Tanacetum cinerariifolium]